MMKKTFPILLIMTILIATTATISIYVPFAEALKSKGNAISLSDSVSISDQITIILNQTYSSMPAVTSIQGNAISLSDSANNGVVCGDRLCSEIKSTNDVSSEKNDEKMKVN